ncbi:MAG TPA: AAA family ATPase [Candidatus Nanopelagicales bacterium]|nr:AAA family ATPase [Candidatus Nanopelagicales bacterium]
MRVTARLIEGAWGKRQVETRLYLHGPVEWPSDPAEVLPWAEANPGRGVDDAASSATRQETLGHRTLASLDVLAPDDVDLLRIEAVLERPLPHDPPALHDAGVTVRLSLGERLEGPAYSTITALRHAVLGRLSRRHAYVPIQVRRIALEGFRGIDQLALDLSATGTSVLVGANGAGKTSVLDAVAILLSLLEARIRMSPEAEHPLEDDDISNRAIRARITMEATVDRRAHRWSLSRERGGEITAAADDQGALFDEMSPLASSARSFEPSLPLFIYYPVNRAVLDIPLRIRTKHLFEALAAYDGALKGGSSNFRLFFEWFRNREDLENEQRIHASAYRDGQLEAVRRAVASLVPGFSNLRVQRSPLRMLVDKGEWTLFVNQLSDGEKCLLAMAGDLARRLAIANPLMDDPLRGGGVVLIDEIELHLHPGWQRHIVPALERTFPHCQFIVTTHSPAVLGHVPPEAIHVLDLTREGIVERRPDASLGMDANRILEDVLGVSERPEKFKEKLLRLFRLIDEGKLHEARALWDDLAAVLGPTAPELARAEVLLMRRERLGR